jgi:hypothetical protein
MRKSFVNFMKIGIAEYLPCLKCRQHCKEYIEKHDPVDKLLTLGQGSSCLQWSWKFHDAVNLREQKKYRPTSEELSAYLKMLREGGGCEDCSVKPSPSVETKRQTAVIRRQMLE